MAQTVLVVGGGNIGGEVIRQLKEKGATVKLASFDAADKPDANLDICDVESVKKLDTVFDKGSIDHVVVCCGASIFGPIGSFDSGKWSQGLKNKLEAVSRLVVMLTNNEEVHILKDGGSITVTAGQLSRTVGKLWPGIAANNAGLEAFVRCAGLDAPRGVRINAVSPAMIRETAVKSGQSIEGTIPAADCAAHFLPLVFGTQTGQVVDAGQQVGLTKSHHAGMKDQHGEGYKGDAPAAAEADKAEEGEPYPDITYGAAVPEKLSSSKMEKKMKKIIKEGGKRGVEIEGAADMGGLQFFCTSVDEPEGDMALLGMCMDAMNAESDPTEEERKGGSGRIGKMIFSACAEHLAVLAYVPEALKDSIDAREWLKKVIDTFGGEVVEGSTLLAKGIVKADADKGKFPLKMKEPCITEAIAYLKAKGLFPDKDDDSDDDYVFGDDDFPS